MTKLKLDALPDDKPVKVTVELPAPVDCDLVAMQRCWSVKPAKPPNIRRN